MAMPEVCQLWIEQRVGEELEDSGSKDKSLRNIGREIAAEIEKYWHVKVDPVAIAMKASRMKSVTSVTHGETPATKPLLAGDSGDNLTPETVIPLVEKVIKRGMSIREAAAVLADEHGKRSDTVRRMYARAREKENYAGTATEAMQFVQIAISQLSRIRKDDQMRQQAFETIKAWIYEQEQDHG